jgi:cobaltochelatase CobN
VLRFITTADTEILATAAAVQRLGDDFPAVRCANPGGAIDQAAFVEDVLDGARVVLCRILGGRRGWPEGFDLLRARCQEQGIALLALGGELEPDAEMTSLSLAPTGAVAQAGEYLRHGDIDNVEQLLRFLADTFLLEGYGFEAPHEVPDLGVYVPGVGDVPIEDALARLHPARPTVGICFYRSHRITGNAAWVDELAAQIEIAGANAIAVWSTTLRRDGDGNVPALALLEGHIDALLVTMLATGGSHAGQVGGSGNGSVRNTDAEQRWDAAAIEALDVPVLQAVCATSSRAAWEESASGLTPLDAATQVAIPEFDGRLLGGVVSFKERGDAGSNVGIAIPRYVADPERCARVARLAVRHARLRATPNADKKIALLLTSFPTKHARVGMAVGLDTPASALGLLDALHDAGYAVERPYAHQVGGSGEETVRNPGDELMHALIAGGGHDPEFVTDEQLQSATLRFPVAEYEAWYATLPAALRASIEERWGPPPGDQFVDQVGGRETNGVSDPGGDFVVAALELGNVLVAIQPPRGYGDDPVGIYHDPELPPTHHYLACYRFLDAAWGADAIVHLGKHGTLEWLPGKMLALSSQCAPDAALGDIPLVYPFIVNDPGEGVQAKRRAHAVIVDHLVPPMMRAESYDELAELEALLDEYARLEILDPPKLPGLAVQIWDAIERANLQADLGVTERPDDLGLLVEHIDGYLCEVKDIQVKDGLHVLGVAPAGPQLRGLTSAMLRLDPSDDVRGLRNSVADALQLDEAALATTAGADRLEEIQLALLDALAARDWSAAAAPEACTEVLGRVDGDVAGALRFAAEIIVPRLLQTTDELTSIVAALDGHHVPAGPSGAPTRGRIDVLPTGRNFYSVDPRALPSQLSWETGQRLAQALLDRHVADHGGLPRMVGLVAWGTSAMRTQGDDAAEIFALLGVRPVWARESRRVTGLEVIALEELGRPRVDVTVRISGFFRDAFPHLVRLLDDAVALVAGLDEPAEQNFVAAHAREDAAALASSLDATPAWRQATTRIFGSKPGAYGAGLAQLLDARDWRDDGDIAEVYEAWGGYAYGRGLDGAQAGDAHRSCFGRIDVAVKNVDSREHDILDSGDYYEYHGGMIATVRAISGREPAAMLGDSSDPARVVSRSLAQETRRVFRARVANPRWIASMIRHGYKGAAELAATVDYLFGYDATTGVAEAWMYEDVARRYLLDEDVGAFMARSNPWAARAIAEKLLEAAERGLWDAPKDETMDAIRARYLELEGQLEEASA